MIAKHRQKLEGGDTRTWTGWREFVAATWPPQRRSLTPAFAANDLHNSQRSTARNSPMPSRRAKAHSALCCGGGEGDFRASQVMYALVSDSLVFSRSRSDSIFNGCRGPKGCGRAAASEFERRTHQTRWLARASARQLAQPRMVTHVMRPRPSASEPRYSSKPC